MSKFAGHSLGFRLYLTLDNYTEEIEGEPLTSWVR